ncbi:GNAT family N-acetyltransferase [Clostridium botulinum]|uniref:Spermine/spermidine acetyltransferase n=1 Tax=Clostridium botulinum (strain Langeland / NCTC 10281 / Type F) TaxID=441772 RepID=A7GEP7_CLOBL|nr:GNAT family N-acetyltransferase [Clostridium botulinum]ABS39999.1 spermine/spermidine acetyltransferase [Clostridium botulinum F str. Langeland]ADF99670.1 spermine/spermidine acetyltransferase [Clostridium botulinum F str. 230613]KKM42755.1 spermidine acetyltransferase [Clostridium botulinum]MBY6791727.1 GNAT family N-acetyltransferase [Clostridium botulinum]MBY6936964.1 GNAT family N-acetyltransferase [Clostridium botulinum]
MNLHLEEVTIKNWRSIAALKANENQQNFIESNAYSLAEWKFVPDFHPKAIYDNNKLIGFAMYGYFKKETRLWLDRFMIDYKYQNKGYGKSSLELLISVMINEYKCNKIYLSTFKDNIGAIKLYEKFGFEFNGEFDENGELIMVLKV